MWFAVGVYSTDLAVNYLVSISIFTAACLVAAVLLIKHAFRVTDDCRRAADFNEEIMQVLARTDSAASFAILRKGSKIIPIKASEELQRLTGSKNLKSLKEMLNQSRLIEKNNEKTYRKLKDQPDDNNAEFNTSIKIVSRHLNRSE